MASPPEVSQIYCYPTQTTASCCFVMARYSHAGSNAGSRPLNRTARLLTGLYRHRRGIIDHSVAVVVLAILPVLLRSRF